MKFKITFLITLFIMLLPKLSYAEKNITADIVRSGRDIIISGMLENSTYPSIVVFSCTADKTMYMMESYSEPDGSFSMVFTMPEYAKVGEYSYTIGTDDDAYFMNGTFDYTFKMNAQAVSDGKRIIISGDLNGYTGMHSMVVMVGDFSNVIYANQILTQEDGSFVFDVVLPYGTKAGEYMYMITTSPNIQDFYGKFDYIPETSDITYETTKTINVTENAFIPYYIEIQSVENAERKRIIIEYPADKLVLEDACIFTTEKEQCPTEVKQLGFDIDVVTDGRIELQLYDGFWSESSVKAVISGVLFKGTSDGVADVVCRITEMTEDN